MPPLKKSFQGLVALCAFVLSAPLAMGLPSYGVSNGNDCSTCHNQRTGRMQVTPQQLQLDLGTQLDGSMRGQLNAYQVEPGSNVTLSIDILDGSGAWAAQLKRLEKGGQQVSLDNYLGWSIGSGTGWTIYGTTAAYLATGINDNTGATSRQVTLAVDPATPPDTYDLVFAMAGKSNGLFYQEEHFYLDVMGATPTWAGYQIAADNNVDTGNWLGWVKVADSNGWVWVYNLSRYVYLPEANAAPSGGWLYIPN